jgi:hypothetical protein
MVWFIAVEDAIVVRISVVRIGADGGFLIIAQTIQIRISRGIVADAQVVGVAYTIAIRVVRIVIGAWMVVVLSQIFVICMNVYLKTIARF